MTPLPAARLAALLAFDAPAGCHAGKVIAITGASGGIGREVALAAARAGASVVLHGRRQARLEALYDEMTALGAPEPAILPLDFATCSEAELEAFAIGVRKDFGRLDGLVHCAAHFTRLTPLANQSLKDIDTHFRVNTAAPLALTRAFLPLLRQTGNARVLFTGETHGLRPAPYWGAFALAKQALASAAVIWSRELASDNAVRLLVLVPGPVASPQRAHSHPADDFSALRHPADLARAYLGLLSPLDDTPSGSIVDFSDFDN